MAHDEGQEPNPHEKNQGARGYCISLLSPSSTAASITERGIFMKDIVFWVLVILVTLLGALLVTAIHQNHNLQREIDGWSDRVMELERMIEPGDK